MNNTRHEVSGQSPGWYWLLLQGSGVVVDGPSVAFTSQEAAESWLQETFAELLDHGVTAVTLMDGERAVYGPMALTPE